MGKGTLLSAFDEILPSGNVFDGGFHPVHGHFVVKRTLLSFPLYNEWIIRFFAVQSYGFKFSKFYIPVMAKQWYLLLGLLLVLCATLAGCMSASIGDISYQNESLEIRATNEEQTSQAVLQVTVYRIQDFTQTEVFKKAEFIEFKAGIDVYTVPVQLEPGTYKVYVYIIVDGDSKARVVRDLVV